MLYDNEASYIYVLSGTDTDLYRYDVALGTTTKVVPTGITGTYSLAFYDGSGVIVVLMDDGKLYSSFNFGTSFSLLYTPPVNYFIYDCVLTSRLEVIVVLEREDDNYADRRIAVTLNAVNFTELACRITYDGRQMNILENARELRVSVASPSNSGSFYLGSNTPYANIVAIDSTGKSIRIPYEIDTTDPTNTQIIWEMSGTDTFKGDIYATVNNNLVRI
jgi:hypothetical protein